MIEPYVINFTNSKDLGDFNQRVLIDSIGKAFAVAVSQQSLEKMRQLNQLAKELRFATDQVIGEMLFGPQRRKEPCLPEGVRMEESHE